MPTAPRPFGVRRRTLRSAWMLLRSGDLAGFARRLWRRLVALLGALGRLGGPIGHVQWRERWVDLTDGEREVVAGWASATRFAVVVG
ncbi:MAG: hypothetical protein ABGY30_05990, partial [Acidimicrobiales bacterium]